MVGAAGQGPAGELAVPLPAGFVRRPSGEVALDPGEDPQVSKPPVGRIAGRGRKPGPALSSGPARQCRNTGNYLPAWKGHATFYLGK